METQRVFAITRGRLNQRPFRVGSVNAIQLLPDDPNRIYLFIQNNSASNMLIGLDGPPNAGGISLTLGPGNFWEPNVTPINSIYVISVGATNAAGVAIFGTLN